MIELIDHITKRPLPFTTVGNIRCFAGQPGQPYAVLVSSSYKSEAVVSVDGRNVISNEPASPDARGYLIDPNDGRGTGGELIIEGFRTSNTEIRRFVFADLGFGLTTTERAGTADAAGIVACALHRGYGPETRLPERFSFDALRSSDRGGEDGFRGGNLRGAAPSLGTAAGAALTSHVREVEFRRSGQPAVIEVIQYDTFEGWARRGVSIPYLNMASPWPGAKTTAYADPRSL